MTKDEKIIWEEQQEHLHKALSLERTVGHLQDLISATRIKDRSLSGRENYVDGRRDFSVKDALPYLEEAVAKCQADADAEWALARRGVKPLADKEPVYQLTSEAVKLAITDYEAAISGGVPDVLDPDSSKIAYEIEAFARDQTFLDIDMPGILKQIRDVYRTKFWPEALDHAEDFIRVEYYRDHKKKIKKLPDHKCPFCGGKLWLDVRVGGTYTICCTFCRLTADIPGNVLLKIWRKLEEQEGKPK